MHRIKTDTGMAKRRNKPNMTPQNQALVDRSTFGGVILNALPSQLVHLAPSRYLRLAFSHPLPKMDVSAARFAASLKHSLIPDTLFFPDTNFFSRPIDFSVWDALIDKRLIIPPTIYSELRPWLTSPFYNQKFSELVRHKIQEGNRSIEILKIDDEYKLNAFNYYYELLCYRKSYGIELHDQLNARLGREPTNAEFRRECQIQCGDIGMKLAIQGKEKQGAIQEQVPSLL